MKRERDTYYITCNNYACFSNPENILSIICTKCEEGTLEIICWRCEKEHVIRRSTMCRIDCECDASIFPMFNRYIFNNYKKGMDPNEK